MADSLAFACACAVVGVIRYRHKTRVVKRKLLLQSIRTFPGPVQELVRSIKGRVLLPSDPDYELARVGGNGWAHTWNRDAMGYPCGIVTVKTLSDIHTVVRYVAEHGSTYPFCVAGGRHSHQCMVDDAIVLDLSKFKNVEVDQKNMTVTCLGGNNIGDVGRALAPLNLAFPTGHSSSTGIAGMMIQGGISYMTRKWGLAVDSLLEVEVVTADGTLWVANETTNRDLFWAVRGGGGNFGVVAKMKFRVCEIPERIYGGMRVYSPFGLWRFPSRRKIITRFRALMETSPGRENGSGMLFMLCDGPVFEVLCHFGSLDDGEAWVASIDQQDARYAWSSKLGPKSYHNDIQRAAQVRPGNKYMSGLLFHEMTQEVAGILAKMVSRSYGVPGCAISIVPLGGKGSQVPNDATAYGHRQAKYWVVLHGSWMGDKSADEQGYARGKSRVETWVGHCKALLNEHIAGHYAVLNHPDVLDATRPIDYGAVGAWLNIRNVFGDNDTKLRKLKKKFDPLNVFSSNDNLLPSEV